MLGNYNNLLFTSSTLLLVSQPHDLCVKINHSFQSHDDGKKERETILVDAIFFNSWNINSLISFFFFVVSRHNVKPFDDTQQRVFFSNHIIYLLYLHRFFLLAAI